MNFAVQKIFDKNQKSKLTFNNIKKELEHVYYSSENELDLFLFSLELTESDYRYNQQEKYIKLASNFFHAGFEDEMPIFKKFNNKDLEKCLTELEKMGLIYLNEYDETYINMPEDYYVVKVKSTNKGILYFEIDGTKHHISAKDLDYVLLSDLIIVKKLKLNYYIDKIIDRQAKIIGEIVMIENEKTIVPFNIESSFPFKIRKNALKKFVEGDRILIKLEPILHDGYFNGQIVEYIGNKKDMSNDAIMTCLAYGFRYNFSKETLKELNSIPTEVIEKDFDNRIDLRHEETFTIDQHDAMDLDDAISITRSYNDGYILKVHISHVAHYVKFGSAIFQDALLNTTSVYTPGAVNPMFPHQISSGICSLSENQNRLVLTVEIEYDENGTRLNHILYPAVIKSKKKMDYEIINSYFNENILPDDYAPFKDSLNLALQLSQKLTVKKIKRGYISFESNEVSFILDENQNPIEINSKGRGKAQELIENFMIEANECVSIQAGTMPFPYRNHGAPKNDRLKQVLQKLKKDLDVKISLTGNLNDNYFIQKILNQFAQEDNFLIISRNILCALPQAYYSSNNIGHFGLALDNYTHFTSPIRRMNDYLVQYLLELYETTKLTDKEIKNLSGVIENICARASEKERAADAVSYLADKLEIAKYMAKNIGAEYEMFIQEIRPNYTIITAKGLLEGKVLHEDFTSDLVNYNPNSKFLNGLSGWVYKPGHQVVVQVKRVSLEEPNVYYNVIDCITKKESLALKKTKSLKKTKNR